MKTYKIRKFQNGKNKKGEPFINYSLTIPSAVAEALDESLQFACELTEDGILFRPTEADTEVKTLPTWAKTSGGKNGASASPAPAAKKSSGGRKASSGRSTGRTRRARPVRK